MNKIRAFARELRTAIRHANRTIKADKKNTADEMISTGKSIRSLYDETVNFVDTFTDDSDAKRVAEYFTKTFIKKREK
jgi:ribosome recycling factor